jgi:hypothetical protein
MSQTTTTFLKISRGSSSFLWKALIGHAFPEEIVVNPRFRWESGQTDGNPAILATSRDANQKWIIPNQISRKLIGNPSLLMSFPKNLSGMLHC